MRILITLVALLTVLLLLPAGCGFQRTGLTPVTPPTPVAPTTEAALASSEEPPVTSPPSQASVPEATNPVTAVPPATPAPTPSVPEADIPAPPAGPIELSVVGHLNLALGPRNISDLWAKTASSGRSYAYVGVFREPSCSPETTGVHIVDITDPGSPQKVAFVPAPAGTYVSDVVVKRFETAFVSGDILVFSIETCRDSTAPPAAKGVVLYDVTDPLKPELLAQNFLDFEVHNAFPYQQGKRAFVLVVQDDSDSDFHVVEITDPVSPVDLVARGWVDWFDPAVDQLFLGELPAPFLHDVWAEVYPDDSPNRAVAGRTIAYLSYWDAGVVLLDITDPASPVFLGDSDYLDPDPLSGQPPEGNAHSAVPAADGRLVFMGDEDFSPTRLKFSVDDGAFSGEYRAAEGSFTAKIEDRAEKAMSGPATFVGLACDTAGIPPPAGLLAQGEVHIALIERGGCPFDAKIANVAGAGYGGAVVFSNIENATQVMTMGGDTAKGTIPALFVSRSTAFAILGMSPDTPPDTALPPPGTIGQRVSARSGVVDGWGYGRILDVSDPANIREVGRYATENVLADPPEAGDHSMHNVVVEGQKAYIAWYADGIRVVDFSDPEKPREVARFIDTVSGSNFWGVYLFKHPDGKSYILGSDMDTGLWILDTAGGGAAAVPGSAAGVAKAAPLQECFRDDVPGK